MHGWMSPNFGPTGCLGAVFWTVLVAGAALGLVALLWWTVLAGT
jgi:hypothetical protein